MSPARLTEAERRELRRYARAAVILSLGSIAYMLCAAALAQLGGAPFPGGWQEGLLVQLSLVQAAVSVTLAG